MTSLPDIFDLKVLSLLLPPHMNMTDPPCSGVVYNDGKTWLPLVDLNVHVSIVDTSSRTILTQTYVYEGSHMLQDAYYIFPLPPDAAVCGFQMKTNDGTSMQGVVKEVSEARQDYEEAKRTNRMASLLEQFRQDRSFLPRTEIVISISFVMGLSSHNDKDDSVRFLLPTYVGHRYGVPPSSKLYTLNGTSHTSGLSFALDVQMSGEILDVRSNYCLEDVPSSTKYACQKRFKSDQTILHKAFMIIIQSVGLDIPRCFSETCEETGTAALSLTLVPRFDSADISSPSQFIFLIDHSGSMSIDRKMEEAKEALKILLHTIPQKNSWFNVYAFDHTLLPLWNTSQRYDSTTFDRALKFTQGLQPEGGTELLSALPTVLHNRMINIPTNLFVLTDGQVINPQGCINVVKNAVATSVSRSPIRVFTLAFGHDASMALCEGLAIAGNGFCSIASEGKQLMKECMNAMNKMMSNQLRSLEVDWCVPGKVHVRQTPARINAFSGKRTTVSALIPKDKVPSNVSILATRPDGSTFKYHVPVRAVQKVPWNLPDNLTLNLEARPFLHVLTAHNFILDLEREMPGLESIIHNWTKLDPVARRDAIQQEIVTLGLQYQLASSRTAFIAVNAPPTRSTSQNNKPRGGPPNPTTASKSKGRKGTNAGHSSPNATPRNSQSSSASPLSQTGNSPSSVSTSNSYRSASTNTDSSTSPPPMPGSFPLQSPPPPVCIFQKPSGSPPVDEVIYFLGKNVPPAVFVAPPSPLETVFFIPARKLYSFITRKFSKLGNVSMTGGVAESEWDKLSQDADSSAFATKFGEIARFQEFDGRFSNLRELCNCLGCISPGAGANIVPPDVDIPVTANREAVWATALALAFFRSKFPKKWLVWKDFARKSLIWGEKVYGSSDKFDLIIERARSFL